MHRGALNAFRCLTTFRLVGGSFVVALYLLTATPLAPMLTAFLAQADRSHHVSIQQKPGGIAVVLRHDCFTPAHRHGFVARTLTVIAQRTTASQPNHVIQFIGCAISAEAARAVEAAPETLTTSDILPSAALPTVSTKHRHLPRDASGFLWNVQSTVLLI